MGWQSRLKKDRKDDPARAERIRAMREEEAKLRESLDNTMRLTREMADRMHYDALAKQCQDRIEALKKDFVEQIERRLDALGPCSLAINELRRECDTLQDRLDARDGRPPRPDPMDSLEPLMGNLTKEQIAGLRFVSAQSRLPALPAPERSDAFDKGRAYMDSVEATFAGFRREADIMLEIVEERTKRGWVSADAVEQHKSALEPYLRQIEGGVEPLRSYFRTSLTEYEALLEERRKLREALSGREDAP